MSQMFLNVVSTFKGDGITQATRQLGTFGKATSGFGSILGKAATALAAFGVVTKTIDFGREAITQARDLERNLYALDTIFGDLSPSMRDFAKDAENIGLSQSKAAKASTFIGSVLKQSGFAMSDVSKETKNLVTLGTDLAALYGYDVQEALLGMTALFRGEYDPIEKFGVAMKQSEINSELAARGQDKLEGAARRNAEQTVRLEMLYQRAADAMGAFTGQSGSLYTEQKKLGATFENMQAQLGTALLPAVADLNEALRIMLVDITPYLIESFERLAVILEGIVGVFNDAMDPTTELGESFAALNIQAESLAETMGIENFEFDVFEFGALVIRSVVDLVHDLMRSFEDLVIHIQVAGQAIHDFFFNREKFDNTDYIAMRDELFAISDGAKDIRLNNETASDAIKNMREEVARADKAKLEMLRDQFGKVGIAANYAAAETRRFREAAGLPGVPPVIVPDPTGTTSTTKGGSAAKPSLSPLQQLYAESDKTAAVLRKEGALERAGLTKEVAQWVTSVNKPIVAAREAQAKIAKNGARAITNITAKYTQSAAGQAAAAKALADSNAQIASDQADADRLAQELRDAEKAALEEQARVYQSFLESVKSTFAGIKNAILGAFDITGLGGSTNSILRNMDKMLVKLRSFSSSVKQLATMGLDPALLQQIISMGPMAGARLASTLVAGGASALSAINAGYGEFGSLASDIATTGTNAMFDREAQRNVYNINVNGGVGSGATIGKAIVDAIKDYERTSGAVWQGA
jgi:hypothetical protein